MEQKRKRIKRINNLTIYYNDSEQHSVWTPYGRCWYDNLTLDEAVEFCKKNTDFVKVRKRPVL